MRPDMMNSKRIVASPENQIGMKKHVCASCGGELFEMVACLGLYVNEITKADISAIQREVRFRCINCGRMVKVDDFRKPPEDAKGV